MNVYFRVPPGMSHAMSRVENALRRHLPSGVTEVTRREDADLEVLHVIGVEGVEDHLASMKAKKYAVIQYCVKTTHWAPHQWLGHLWSNFPLECTCVWSYYDLQALINEDYMKDLPAGGIIPTLHNFYHAPLGVDSIFRRWADKEKYIAACTGYVAESECLHEVAKAAGDKKVFHLGPPDVFKDFTNVKWMHGISDDVLAQMYSRCRYVTGLRRTEGFELPLAEGLLCGALPITFDQPHYRKWFDGLSAFIQEDEPHIVQAQLADLFANGQARATPDMMNEARARFNWHNIAPNFWGRALSSPGHVVQRTLIKTAEQSPPVNVSFPAKQQKRVLWVGDAGVSSGFAVATHKTCDELVKTHDVRVLGLHHNGDPHPYNYPIYTTWMLGGGDVFGTKKLPDIIDSWTPDIVVIQQDPWNFPSHTQHLMDKWKEDPKAHRPIMIGAVAVDGLNCRGRGLRHLDHCVFWTNFGRDEAVKGGWDGPSSVIPLGVDQANYFPVDKAIARRFFSLTDYLDSFIVGYVGRNQPRKRLDLLLRYFAEWMRVEKPDNAKLYIHYAPTGEDAYDLQQLGHYYGINGHILAARPAIGYGASPKAMRMTYNVFDVFASTTQGEGMGLPHIESMACGIPNIYPAWSALNEIIGDTGAAVTCTSVTTTPNRINAIGGIADEQLFVAALSLLYRDSEMRADLSSRSMQRASEDRFSWLNVGKAWNDLVNTVERRSVPDEVLLLA